MLEILDEAGKRYLGYLKSLFYIRDPGLRRSFAEALARAELVKGPYLEATQVFRRTGTLEAVLGEIDPGRSFDSDFLRALDGSRPLYDHQAQALSRVLSGENVVVATGTGSGKTESFLYPMLADLYRRQMDGGPHLPGVRALILYPMNALAHDQRRRLNEIALRLQEGASPFRFTFGQYIGSTPENCSELPGRCPPAQTGGEFLCRMHMRQRPPDILITNYSMLEYLLLRPRDIPLFSDARHWSFVVIDEAHQYRGTLGLEVGMLLRRLMRRLEQSGLPRPPRCVATSASLADPQHRAEVARFASRLFGQPFLSEGVLLGTADPLGEFGDRSLPPARYRELLPPRQEDEGARLMAGRALLGDARTGRFAARVRQGPVHIEDLARELFPDVPPHQGVEFVDDLAQCATRALTSSRTPLLSLRYHLFVRALGDVSLALSPTPEIKLGTADLGQAEESAASFAIALCRRCGQHYLVGSVIDGALREANRDRASEDYGATFLMPVGPVHSTSELTGERSFEELRTLLDPDDDSVPPLWALCPTCGALVPASPASSPALPCNHGSVLLVAQAPTHPGDDAAARRCLRCGYNFHDPLREFTHGADGPQSVIATALLDQAPPDMRKLLTFVDGRQRAAFFAWYMDDTYRSTLERSLLVHCFDRLANDNPETGSFSLASWVDALRRDKRLGLLLEDKADVVQVGKKAWALVLREVLTRDHGVSLQDTGLVVGGLDPADPDLRRLAEETRWPEPFARLPLEQRANLTVALLETCAWREAVRLESVVPGRIPIQWGDLGLEGQPTTVHLEGAAHEGTAWDSRTTTRAEYLRKLQSVLGVRPSTEAAQRALRELWAALATSVPGPMEFSGPHGTLDLKWWRVRRGRDALLCDTCQRVYASSALGVCPTRGCSGRLAPVGDRLDANHYRRLYLEPQRRPIRVEEHTAQITSARAAQIEQEFSAGKVQVLSSSTTFELGVDLGDLYMVMLRNVPPEPFHYLQRAGRAGRRGWYPGIVVTYCGMSPHDLYHFRQPERMLSGRSRPAAIPLGNRRIIGRHIMAQALATFFREHDERFANVQDLLARWDQPVLIDDLSAFFHSHREELVADAAAILAGTDLPSEDAWEQWLAPLLRKGEIGRLHQALEEVQGDYAAAQALKRSADEREDTDSYQWAVERMRTIREEKVPQFLSRLAVIPKYGFPVDVVELEVLTNGKQAPPVQLERDLALAISEFAPGSEVVASKLLFQSRVVKRVAGQQWRRVSYWLCRRHGRLVSAEGDWTDEHGVCCAEMRRMPEPYVVPAFGFSTGRIRPKSPSRAPRRQYATRPYFADRPGTRWDGSAYEQLQVGRGRVHVYGVVQGKVVILSPGSKGQGFRICRDCGAAPSAYPSRENSRRKFPRGQHLDPFGQPCSGQLMTVALGHELVTDVMRLEFRVPDPPTDPAFAPSLAEALHLGAVDLLQVPLRDVNGIILQGEDIPACTVILYDATPGGGGLVTQLSSPGMLAGLLEYAHDRVRGGCACAETSSCYGCLRTYENQYLHATLRRGLVLDYLNAMLGP